MIVERMALDAGEVAESCGIGEDAVRAAEKAGELVGVRIGRSLRFQPDQVKAWLDDLQARRRAA